MVFLVSLLCCGTACADASPSRHSSIVVENRVLATVRDQVITVVDVMKKLDMIFCQQFPQYRGVPEARYEFYQSNWRKVFEELVDRQLIISMAEEKQFVVTNGDIRQELEDVFGPNVMMSLYEEGLSMHEVHEMMKADILLRRIISFYVHSPVVNAITPEVLRLAYQKRVEELKGKEGWIWRSMTVKSKGNDCPKAVAEKVWNLLEKDHQPIETIASKLPNDIECVISLPFRSEQREVAPAIQHILEMLPLHSFSEPMPFTNRSDPHQSWRCYIVDERFEPKAPTFLELEIAIRQELASPEITKRTITFFDDLRKQYYVKHIFSSEQLMAFEPFQLKQKST
jgi:hypothetical protein